MKDNIKPITLNIDKELWGEFKRITPRTRTLNDAIVELIKEKILKFNTDERRLKKL